MKLETDQDLEIAVSRLAQRTPDSLANFIASFAYESGPIGEQVRTFIVGDDLTARRESLSERIYAFRPSKHRRVHRGEGAQVGERLEFILDSLAVRATYASPDTVRVRCCSLRRRFESPDGLSTSHAASDRNSRSATAFA